MSKNSKENNIHPCFYRFMTSELKKPNTKLLVSAILSSSIKITLEFPEKNIFLKVFHAVHIYI